MADRQAPGKGNGVKSEPLWGQNKTIVFAQAQPEDVVELWRVMQAAYAEFREKLDSTSGAFAETPATLQPGFAEPTSVTMEKQLVHDGVNRPMVVQ